MGLPEDLERLRELHAEGTLSDDEYEKAKDRLLTGRHVDGPVVVKFVAPAWLKPLAAIGALASLAVVVGQCQSAQQGVAEAVNDMRNARVSACIEVYFDDREAREACIDEAGG